MYGGENGVSMVFIRQGGFPLSTFNKKTLHLSLIKAKIFTIRTLMNRVGIWWGFRGDGRWVCLYQCHPDRFPNNVAVENDLPQFLKYVLSICNILKVRTDSGSSCGCITPRLAKRMETSWAHSSRSWVLNPWLLKKTFLLQQNHVLPLWARSHPPGWWSW